jgi:3-hydroxyacyl-[acyl-carrier-protein] dehydratase
MFKAFVMKAYSDILKYIPQRPPFVMVDTLITVSDNQTISNFTITPENLFCENGFFYEGGMIENIAQSVAAGAGYKYLENKEEPPAGMIGTIKKLQIRKRPKIGETIQTEVRLIASFDNALVVEGFISVNNEIIVQCQMNIFIFRDLKIARS